MRGTLFLGILLFINVDAFTQKKTPSAQLKQLDQLIENIDLLNSVEILNQKIYLGSTSWVYMENIDLAERSRVVLLDESTEVLRRLDPGRSKLPQAEIIISEMKKNIESATQISQSLVSYFDYYDSTDQRTPKSKEAEVRLNNDIKVRFFEIKNLIQTIKNGEENELNKIFTSYSEKPAYSSINREYLDLAILHDVRTLNWELCFGTFYWIHLSKDSLLSESFIENMNVIYFKVQNILKNSSNPQVVAIANDLDKLQKGAIEITNLMKSNDKDELAMNAFLAMDKFETVIVQTYFKLTTTLEEIAPLEKSEVKNLLGGDAKIEDIKKMLRNNYPGAVKAAYPQPTLDSLIEKLVPIYTKKFTHEEIKEILRFQESKVGKKLKEISDAILTKSLKNN